MSNFRNNPTKTLFYRKNCGNIYLNSLGKDEKRNENEKNSVQKASQDFSSNVSVCFFNKKF